MIYVRSSPLRQAVPSGGGETGNADQLRGDSSPLCMIEEDRPHLKAPKWPLTAFGTPAAGQGGISVFPASSLLVDRNPRDHPAPTVFC